MTVVAMFVMQEMPNICSLIDYRFPRYVFVFFPIIFAVGSIPLCILGAAAEEGERRFPVKWVNVHFMGVHRSSAELTGRL